MYQWVVFVHVASVLAFMLAHGVHVVAMLAFRGEPDPERALTFFNYLPNAKGIRILLSVTVGTGVLTGFMGSWWTSGWIWTSLAVLVVIWVAMWRYGGSFVGLIEEAAEAAIVARSPGSANPGAQAAYDAARRSWQPIGLSLVGLGGLAVILWLMMFKPF